MKTQSKIARKLLKVQLPTGKFTTVMVPVEFLELASTVMGGPQAVRQYANEALKAPFQGTQTSAVVAGLGRAVFNRLQALSARVTELTGAGSTAPGYCAHDLPHVIDLDSEELKNLTAPRVLARQFFAGYLVTWEAIPWKLFKTFDVCPFQRNTEAHADVAAHLSEASALHSSVMATRLPDGRINILDAHTRTYKQTIGELAHADVLMCLVVHCNDLADVKSFYDQVDNLTAAERQKEKQYGLFRSQSFKPQSQFFSSGDFKTALDQALYGSVSRKAKALSDADLELVKQADSLLIGQGKVRSMVGAAVILGVKKLVESTRSSHISSIGDFLDELNGGVPATGRLSAAQLLAHKLSLKVNRGAAAGQKAVLSQALAALYLHLNFPATTYGRDQELSMSRELFLGAELSLARDKVKAKSRKKTTNSTTVSVPAAKQLLSDKAAPAVLPVLEKMVKAEKPVAVVKTDVVKLSVGTTPGLPRPAAKRPLKAVKTASLTRDTEAEAQADAWLQSVLAGK